MKNRTTEKEITTLQENEIFVFGSNKNGDHAGGAALFAKNNFGAEQGIGRGMTGQCFAIDTMSGLIEANEQIAAFINFARLTTDKTFLVTEIGCGIAGFKAEQIAPFFEKVKEISNIHLPKSFWDIIGTEIVIHGYKGFNKGLICRDFQYEEGKEYTHTGNVKACESGFHFCEHPLNTFVYYPPSTSIFHEVKGSGKISREESDTKVSCSKISIGVQLNFKSLIDAAIKFTFDRAIWNKDGAASATGDQGAASATGRYGAASATGYQGAASATGYQGAASATGRYGAASATGDQGAASATGDDSIATSCGIDGKAKASKGNWIVVSEWKQDENNIWKRIDVKAIIVDGEKIKEDTYYKLINGEFKEI